MIFRVAMHMTRRVEVVEVFDDESHLMATIYPGDDNAIRIMSLHVDSIVTLKDVDGFEAINVAFKDRN